MNSRVNNMADVVGYRAERSEDQLNMLVAHIKLTDVLRENSYSSTLVVPEANIGRFMSFMSLPGTSTQLPKPP